MSKYTITLSNEDGIVIDEVHVNTEERLLELPPIDYCPCDGCNEYFEWSTMKEEFATLLCKSCMDKRHEETAMHLPPAEG